MTDETKVCSRCRERKLIEVFQRQSQEPCGRRSECKECTSKYQRAYKKANRTKMREMGRRYRQANPEKAREKNRKYIITNPEKVRAKAAVWRAVHSGKLHKPQECAECNQYVGRLRLHGHHEDYGKPLEVTWLCPQCHSDAHHRREA